MSRLFNHLRRGFGENTRFALLAVRTHKLRAFLTVLGIVVGVATVIAMVSIVTGFNNNMIRNFQSFGATLVQFQKFESRFGHGGRPADERRRKDLTYEDAVALKESIPEMRAVSPERYLWNQDISVKYRDNETTTPVVAGVSPDYSVANNHFVGYGRFITESDFRHTATSRSSARTSETSSFLERIRWRRSSTSTARSSSSSEFSRRRARCSAGPTTTSS